LQTKLEKRYSKGLSIISTYVWSHAIDNSPGNFCIGGTGPTTCGFSNPLIPDLDKASADFDVRHRFTIASVWDLPFGRGRRYGSNISPGLDAVIGGWQFNNNITIQSGPPFSIFKDGTRADIITGTCTTGTAKTFAGQTFCPARTPVFANDPNGPKYGLSGRNIFRGDRQEFWDASLFKNIKVPVVSEDFTVQLRIQAYNLLNHRNGFRPENNLSSSNFGLDTFEQRRRQMEFAIKLLW
jgi:hypothetical protein